MAAYEGRHAELYDLFYEAKDYAGEARHVAGRLAAHAEGPVRRVVDLACGTGRHAFALEGLGLEVVGVDGSPSMLEVARRAAAARGSRVRFELQDLRRLDVPGAPFDAATCLFDSLGYLTDPADLDTGLRGVARTVRPGGLLVVELWHASAMLAHHDPVRVRRFGTPTARVIRIAETRLDLDLSVGEVAYEVVELGNDGRWAAFRETQRNRFFRLEEIEHLLTTHGFAPIESSGGYGVGIPVDERAFHVVVVARRGRP